MKKVYAKPQIAFEDFSLSTSVASGCTYISNHIVEVCGYEDPIEEITIFNSGWRDCAMANPDPSVCYDIPEGGYGLFSS